MNNALIGDTGFIGKNLLKLCSQFTHFYNSSNIDNINYMDFDLVICAGAPAQKWQANLEPIKDYNNINKLMRNLSTIKVNLFVLISTVDVFPNPIDVYEYTKVDEINQTAYGKNRYLLERFISSHFDKYLIIRLPGVLGPGLKKNIIYDIHNNRNIYQYNNNTTFQFYSIKNLFIDIEKAKSLNTHILHLTAEPIKVKDIYELGFSINAPPRNNSLDVSKYDFKSIYSKKMGGDTNYLYDIDYVINEIRKYTQYEPRSKDEY